LYLRDKVVDISGLIIFTYARKEIPRSSSIFEGVGALASSEKGEGDIKADLGHLIMIPDPFVVLNCLSIVRESSVEVSLLTINGPKSMLDHSKIIDCILWQEIERLVIRSCRLIQESHQLPLGMSCGLRLLETLQDHLPKLPDTFSFPEPVTWLAEVQTISVPEFRRGEVSEVCQTQICMAEVEGTDRRPGLLSDARRELQRLFISCHALHATLFSLNFAEFVQGGCEGPDLVLLSGVQIVRRMT